MLASLKPSVADASVDTRLRRSSVVFLESFGMSYRSEVQQYIQYESEKLCLESL